MLQKTLTTELVVAEDFDDLLDLDYIQTNQNESDSADILPTTLKSTTTSTTTTTITTTTIKPKTRIMPGIRKKIITSNHSLIPVVKPTKSNVTIKTIPNSTLQPRIILNSTIIDKTFTLKNHTKIYSPINGSELSIEQVEDPITKLYIQCRFHFPGEITYCERIKQYFSSRQLSTSYRSFLDTVKYLLGLNYIYLDDIATKELESRIMELPRNNSQAIESIKKGWQLYEKAINQPAISKALQNYRASSSIKSCDKKEEESSKKNFINECWFHFPIISDYCELLNKLNRVKPMSIE